MYIYYYYRCTWIRFLCYYLIELSAEKAVHIIALSKLVNFHFSDSQFRLPIIMRTWNLTENEYLQYILGPRYLPLEIAVPLTLVYLTIFICGAFGNVITCLVIYTYPSIQTATNFYIFSLAVSDLIILVLGMSNANEMFVRYMVVAPLQLFE